MRQIYDVVFSWVFLRWLYEGSERKRKDITGNLKEQVDLDFRDKWLPYPNRGSEQRKNCEEQVIILVYFFLTNRKSLSLPYTEYYH